MIKIYLAGGFRSNWQSEVISKFKDQFVFFNPQQHKLQAPDQYTSWDLHQVKNADILFGYMEESNPSGLGLAVEIGYAKALNKTIILVDEKSNQDEKFARYFQMSRVCSNVVFNDLDSGLDYLSSFIHTREVDN